MLTGKRALVTGAAQGMGRDIAIEYARRGAEFVGVADLNGDGAKEVAAEIEAMGVAAAAITVDLADSSAIAGMIDTVVSAAGGLDTLVNNAGVMENAFTEHTTFEELPEDVWDKVYAINVKSVWLATKFAAPHLRTSGRGASVINAAPSQAWSATAAPRIRRARPPSSSSPVPLRLHCLPMSASTHSPRARSRPR